MSGGWLQGTSYPPQPCLISAKSADPWHKVVRRGVSPAFSPENIRCGISLSRHLLVETTGLLAFVLILKLRVALHRQDISRPRLFLNVQQWLRCPCEIA